MRLDEGGCWTRLARAERGVLATVHASRGVDVVPVVFALHGGDILVPVDAVKAKAGSRLQRLANLDRDDRCAVLVDHYEADWSRLWWVRVHGRAVERPPTPDLVAPLAARYPAYRASGTVTSVLVVTPTAVTGWAAG